MTKIVSTLGLFALLVTGCTQKDEVASITPTPTFTVVNAGETMPVWVEGKKDARVILLAVHGGPGSDVLDFRNHRGGTGFQGVEAQYQVAYWQQRASGQSVGENNTSRYTISQYVEDLDKVVDELKRRYPDKKLALLGHSWGGMLTSSYLADGTRRAKVDGWINAAGVTNGTTLFALTRADLIAEADARIALGENTAYWQNVKVQAQNAAANVNALAYEVETKIPQITNPINMSEFKFSQRAGASNSTLLPAVVATNNTASLRNFNKAVLVLWGQYDFAVSRRMRDEAVQNLTSSTITSVRFSASGHYMMFQEPVLFASSINTFLSRL
jgi:pimeloyl-ACP methyl ester carboxylesterase